MEKADVGAVSKLLNSHLDEHYKVHITFSDAEVGHWLLPRENVIHSWVVEDEKEGITDVMSYY